jgi:hypothetical protein
MRKDALALVLCSLGAVAWLITVPSHAGAG